MKLQGKVALVTGANRGIGRGCAEEMAREGADVVINYRGHAEEAEDVAAGIRATGREALVVQADVSDRQAVDALVAAAVNRFGRLDIAVANAAYSVRKPFLELTPEDVGATWAVSLWGVFHTCQAAALQMALQGQGGNIIVISSVHASIPFGNSTAYNTAKAGITHMALTIATELAAHQIRVNVVEPGWIDTPGERAFIAEADLIEHGQRLPWGRLGTIQEVGRGVAFLASDDAEYITGANLRVDGGFCLPVRGRQLVV